MNEDYKLSLITNSNYARAILHRTTNADLVGIEIKLGEAYVPKAGLLGYDVIDGECSTSIITNWGTDKENLINPHLISNGLIDGLA